MFKLYKKENEFIWSLVLTFSSLEEAKAYGAQELSSFDYNIEEVLNDCSILVFSDVIPEPTPEPIPEPVPEVPEEVVSEPEVI